ncbi:ABC transporter [Propioniciclava sinopodophylli]|uniref:Transport permease protein n=1 Tax=Propioniciclava sinopodophylli TaxID=1837344 RepID=A0A4Q9KC70_9ACTN|nr:ABC transporter permease [Propioniciclava sinopodophylli]TBT83375.1 ABC transporter [Propioniciclava sinopodophylli]
MGGRPPLREYLRELGERRHFITMQAWSSATHQHRGMLLGNLWMILQPILDGLVFLLIFGVILRANRGIENYTGYLVIGVLMFSFTSRCITAGASSVHDGKALVQAFSFPRAALPLANALRQTISTIPVLVAVVLLVLVTAGPGVVSGSWVMLPLLFLMHTWLNTGLSLIVARWGALIPDVRQLLSYVVRFLMFTSAVMIPIDRFAEALPWSRPILEANPIYIILTMYRDALLYSTMPDTMHWATLTAWALVLSVVGMVYFWAAEVKYGRRR